MNDDALAALWVTVQVIHFDGGIRQIPADQLTLFERLKLSRYLGIETICDTGMGATGVMSKRKGSCVDTKCERDKFPQRGYQALDVSPCLHLL